MTRWKKRLGYFLLFLLAVLFVITWWILPTYITKVNTMAELRGGKKPNLRGIEQYGKLMTIAGEGEAQLSCLWMTAEQDLGTVLFFHGIRNNKSQLLNAAKLVQQAGFNALLVDGRAHGLSNLEYSTFGVKEALDTRAIIDHLEQLEMGNGKYAVWGYSLGGSVALQSLAADERIDAGVIECTFSDFREIAHRYMGRFAAELGWYGDVLITRAAWMADFDASDACTACICPQVEQPVFFGHGTRDRSIPMEMGRKNYNAVSSKTKIFREVHNAGHRSLHRHGGTEYLNEIVTFLTQQLK